MDIGASRIEGGVERSRYVGLLGLLILTYFLIVSSARTGPGRVAGVVATLGIAVLALRMARVRRGTLRVAIVACTAAAVGGLVSEAVFSGAGFHTVEGVLFLVAIAAVLRHLVRGRMPTVQLVAAALCVYVMLGLEFGTVYYVLDLLSDGPFLVRPDGGPVLPGDYFYYSVITLTTTGYGDFVPATQVGRALGSLEALLSQTFLATTVASVVSIAVSRRDSDGGRRE